MVPLTSKSVVVFGRSRGVGSRIVVRAVRDGPGVKICKLSEPAHRAWGSCERPTRLVKARPEMCCVSASLRCRSRDQVGAGSNCEFQRPLVKRLGLGVAALL